MASVGSVGSVGSVPGIVRIVTRPGRGRGERAGGLRAQLHPQHVSGSSGRVRPRLLVACHGHLSSSPRGPSTKVGGGLTAGSNEIPAGTKWRSALATARAPASPFDRLNPLTRVVVSLAGVAGAVLLPSPAWPLAGLVLGLAVTILARRLARLWRPTLGAAFVVGLLGAALTVATGRTADDALARLVDTGLRTALAVLSLGLLALSADPALLGLDLERRGLGHRLAFGTAALVAAAPAVGRRIGTVAAAQQARGLRIGGGPLGRIRAIAPIWLPALVSTLGRLVDRNVALESRAFGHPGRRDLLWAPADPSWERALRWLLAAAIGLGLALRLGQAAGLV